MCCIHIHHAFIMPSLNELAAVTALLFGTSFFFRIHKKSLTSASWSRPLSRYLQLCYKKYALEIISKTCNSFIQYGKKLLRCTYST